MKTRAFIKRNSSYLFKKIGEEIAVISSDDSTLYILNPVAAFVWGLTDKPKDVEKLREAIVSEFEVGNLKAQSDLENFLKDIKSSLKGLFKVSRVS